MTPESLAALHARCFERTPPPWSATAFASACAAPETILLEDHGAFLLGRVAAGEAELLTLAVAPEARRRGLARRLCLRFAEEARARGVQDAFLEVAADNEAARALYSACGWREAGLRPRYYAGAVDALTLKLDLRAHADSD